MVLKEVKSTLSMENKDELMDERWREGRLKLGEREEKGKRKKGKPQKLVFKWQKP